MKIVGKLLQKPVAFTVAQTTVCAALAIHIGFTTIRETPVLMLSRRNRDTDWLVAHLQARVCLDAYCISTKNAYTILRIYGTCKQSSIALYLFV